MKSRLSRIVSICFLLLVVVSVVGCFSRGQSSIMNEDNLVKITEGKTTKAEVKEILGKPQSIQTAGFGREQWMYMYASGWMIPKSNSVTIMFDDKGVVTQMRTNMSQ